MAIASMNQPVPYSGATGVGTPPTPGTIMASAAYSATTYNSAEMANAGCRGVRIYCNITNANSGTVTVKVQTKDPVSGNFVDMTGGTSAAWNANQTKTLTIYPGITAATGTATTNTEVSNFLSQEWRVVVTVAAATVTFSVSAEYLL